MNKKIQILRALAIIAVVMIHSNAVGYTGVVIRPFINFAVAMFIFLSGYLTKLDICDLKKFYLKRISRVLVPYCIWSVIYTIARGNYSDFIKNFFTAQCCGIFYYIFVYIQLILITPMVGKLIKSKYRWIGWFITPISIILIRYVLILINIPVEAPWNDVFFVVWFIYYYIGILLGNNVIEYKFNFKLTILLYIFTLALSEGEGLVWYLSGNYDMATTQLRLTSVLTSMIVILLSYLFIRDETLVIKDNKLTNLFVVTGNCSFGIYLSHLLVMAVLNKIPKYVFLPFPITTIIIIFTTLLCVLFGRKVLGKKSWCLGL